MAEPITAIGGMLLLNAFRNRMLDRQSNRNARAFADRYTNPNVTLDPNLNLDPNANLNPNPNLTLNPNPNINLDSQNQMLPMMQNNMLPSGTNLSPQGQRALTSVQQNLPTVGNNQGVSLNQGVSFNRAGLPPLEPPNQIRTNPQVIAQLRADLDSPDRSVRNRAETMLYQIQQQEIQNQYVTPNVELEDYFDNKLGRMVKINKADPRMLRFIQSGRLVDPEVREKYGTTPIPWTTASNQLKTKIRDDYRGLKKPILAVANEVVDASDTLATTLKNLISKGETITYTGRNLYDVVKNGQHLDQDGNISDDFKNSFEGRGVLGIALVNAFQRIIDPGAVVREGDVALIRSTQGLAQRFRQFLSKVESDGQIVLDAQNMAEMLKISEDIKNNVQNKTYERLQEEAQTLGARGFALSDVDPALYKKFNPLRKAETYNPNDPIAYKEDIQRVGASSGERDRSKWLGNQIKKDARIYGKSMKDMLDIYRRSGFDVQYKDGKFVDDTDYGVDMQTGKNVFSAPRSYFESPLF